MRRRYGSGLTKIMCAGSGVLLAVLLIGAIKMPLVGSSSFRSIEQVDS